MKAFLPHQLLRFLIAICLYFAISDTLYAQDSIPQQDLKSYFNTARKLRNQDKIKLALETINKAANKAEENDDVKGLVDCLHEMALIYLDVDKVDDTQFYWGRASVLLKDISHPFGDAMHKYIDAILLYKHNRKFQALFILNEARQINNDRNFYNNVLLSEVDIYLDLDKYESATKNLNSLIANTDLYERDYLKSQAHLKLASLQLQTKEFLEASENAEKALELADANGFSKDAKIANEYLIKAYNKLGEYEKSVARYKSLFKLRDSIFTVNKSKIEVNTADKIKDDFKTEEIERQSDKITELKESQNRSEITAILTSAFLIIISLLAVTLYRNNQIKLKTNDLLQNKNNELLTAKNDAIKAVEAKTNFLSTVSHELRTPLYAVTGLTRVLLDENPLEHQKEHLKSLKFSGDYLLEFINDILQVNKLDSRKIETLNTEFSLKKLVKEIIKTLDQKAIDNNTKVTLEYDHEIPEILASDTVKLNQILTNLINNSIKFTKDGEVRVIIKLVNNSEGHAKIHFDITDNGIGISKEKQQSIFDDFEQGSIQINREYGGTGLGLTIVKSLLNILNSKIELHSELGKGSSFSFEIGMKSITPKKTEVNKETQTPTDIPTSLDFDFTGLHLLIVEDNKINQVITKKMLTKKEMTCDIADNGTLAVELVEKNKYDAILMDIHMPGISGEEATILIRKFDQKTPIIALTAISLDESLESFYAAGCDDVCTKPFKPEIFYHKIGDNINKKKQPNS